MTSLKSSQREIQFCLRPILIGSLPTKLRGPKVVKIPTLGISGLPFESPRKKCHLDVGLVERHKIYYNGEGGGFL